MPGPYEVEMVETPYARPGGRELLARVYRPTGEAPTPRGAVVYLHGGAWARSDRTADAILCQALAASGRVVVAVDFRQAPDHRFPAASADVAAGGRIEHAHFAEARHGFAQQESPATEKCVAQVLDFVGRQTGHPSHA